MVTIAVLIAYCMHALNSIMCQQVVSSHQPILKVQPFQKTQQPPVHAVHPQPVQTTIHHPSPQQQHQEMTNHTAPPSTSYVVNLTPEQLEQLKRNGQLTVNGQTIYMQRPNKTAALIQQRQAPIQALAVAEENKKMSPKTKSIKKIVHQNKVCVKCSQRPVVSCFTSYSGASEQQ